MEERRNGNTAIFIWTGVTVLAVLVAFFLLNYFNLLSLSEIFPSAFGWLPQRIVIKAPRQPALTSQQPTTAPQTNLTFTPNFNPETQKGPLVQKYVVLYTLVGKITKVQAGSEPGKYNIEVTSRDGSQKYQVVDVGGEGILKATNRAAEITWEDLKEGDDVFVDLSVSSKDGGNVFIGAISVLSR